jgi:sugar phosphate isomerase/epimerase
VNNILAGHTNSYHTYSLDQALAGIAGAGFKYVELSAVRGWTEHVPLEATDEQIAAIRASLDRAGLRISALSGHSDLTLPEGLVDGKKAVDLCPRLDVNLMITAVGGHAGKEENKAAFLSHIFDLANYAARRNVFLALEVHGDIMASGAVSLPLIKEINRANVRINYDTANCVFYGGVPAVDDIRAVVPYLSHIHLKDTRGGKGVWDFPAVGEGHVNFARILKILAEEGYTNPFSVEIEFSGEPWPPVEEVHRSMQVSYATLKQLGLS